MDKKKEKGVTAVIACHNSSRVIEPTIKALLNQKITDSVTLEIILVDNNCTDNTVDKALEIYKQYSGSIQFRVIQEKEPGAAYARRSAVLDCSCEIVSFVDDDNILQEDWVQKVVDLFATKPDVGIIGGLNEAYIVGDKPKWFVKFQATYACGPQAGRSSYVTDRTYVFGAGASFRTQILLDIYTSRLPLFLTGKKQGTFMFSGNDSEICLRAILMGWELWYQENLVLKHYLLTDRLSWQTLCRTQMAHSASSIVLDIYQDLIKRLNVKSYPRQFYRVIKSYCLFYIGHFLKGTLKQIKVTGEWLGLLHWHHNGVLRGTLLFWNKYSKIKKQISLFYRDNNYSKPQESGDLKKEEKKYLHSYRIIDKDEQDGLFGSAFDSLELHTDYQDNFRLLKIRTKWKRKGPSILYIYFLWESLKKQVLDYSSAVTVADETDVNLFWNRHSLGKSRSLAAPGDRIAGIVAIPAYKILDPQRKVLGVRVVIPGKTGLKIESASHSYKTDSRNTRLLIPLTDILETDSTYTRWHQAKKIQSSLVKAIEDVLPHYRKETFCDFKIKSIYKNYFIKDCYIYCKLRITLDDDSVLDDHSNTAIYLASNKNIGFSYLFACRVISVKRLLVLESNIDLYTIEKDIYSVYLHINGKRIPCGETVDTSNLLDLNSTYDDLLISIHIPKTAGTTFGTLLSNSFNDNFLYHEYMRIDAPEALLRKERSINDRSGVHSPLTPILGGFERENSAVAGDFCIHGHFTVNNYMTQFPGLINNARFIAWFREPAERVVSQYAFTKRDAQNILKFDKYAYLPRKMVEENLTLEEFAELEHVKNLQHKFITPLTPKDLLFVGIQEEFDKSIRLVRKMLGIADDVTYQNKKISKEKHSLKPDVRDYIYKYNRLDLKIYEEAKERFELLCLEYDVV